MERAQSTERVVFVCDGTEMRRVTVSDGEDGSLVVVEQTDGELTYEIFGTLSHQQSVRIAPEHLPEVQEMLKTPCDARHALRDFLSHDDVFLTDLLDRLDRAGIPYSYAKTTSGDTLVRMPQDLPHADQAPVAAPQYDPSFMERL